MKRPADQSKITPPESTFQSGPSASSAPEWYPEADIIHCGEVGDATRQLFELIDRAPERYPRQIILRTVERLPMTELPMPAYHLINLRNYFLGTVQFSSGCPHHCDYCMHASNYTHTVRLQPADSPSHYR